MSRRKKPSHKIPATPPGQPDKSSRKPFYADITGRKGRPGDHPGKGSSGWLPKGG